MSTKQVFFEAIKCEIDGTVLSVRDKEFDPQKLTALAKKYALLNIVADAMQKADGLSDDPSVREDYKKTALFAAARVEKTQAVLELTCRTLAKAKIDFVPLKGAVLRELYPATWMRSSCDIDILVKETQLEKAIETLKAEGFTTDGERGFHDVSLFYYGVHLELHFSILENAERFDPLLQQVWQNVIPVSEYEYRMTPEFYTFYHLAHMAHHLFLGGCGVRPFVDLYVLQKCRFYDKQKLEPLLEQCNLMPFYNGVLAQLAVWFGRSPYDRNTELLEQYIFRGGVFGDMRMSIAARTAKHNGKIGNVLATAFPPYFNMQQIYPALRHKWQLPYYHLKRLCRKLSGDSRRRASRKFSELVQQDASDVNFVNELLEHLELKDKMNEPS